MLDHLINVQGWPHSKVTGQMIEIKRRHWWELSPRQQQLRHWPHTKKLHQTPHSVKIESTKSETTPYTTYNSHFKMYFEITLVYHTNWWQFISCCSSSLYVWWVIKDQSLPVLTFDEVWKYFLYRMCNSNINQLFKSVASQDDTTDFYPSLDY